MKKKLLALLLVMTMVMALVACGGNQNSNNNQTTEPPAQTNDNNQTPDPEPAPEPAGASEITLWLYPVGGWGDETKVKPLLDSFTADTGIKVNVEWLAYADGDDKVNTAIAAKNAPDLVMEGPERLVANWGASGYMVDLSDMIDDGDRSEIAPAILDAATASSGEVYMYPMFMTANCMAVNYDAVKEAGAEANIDLNTRTWTVEQFDATVKALYEKYGDTVAAVYCAGQGGDQGTRELIRNRYGTNLTNADHTGYTWNTPEVINALTDLRDLEGINYDASLAGGDEIALFYQGILKMAFCWNAAQQLNPNSAGTGAGKTLNGEEIVYMCFPTQDGTNSQLGSGAWGLGIFDNGDQGRIDAAKQFIQYMCDSEHTAEAADVAGFLSARTNVEASDPILVEFCDKMIPHTGEYYQITTGWAEARTAWWNMLQKVGEGADVAATVAEYEAQANAVTG